MILLKQLLIFLKLKYQETIGKHPKDVIAFLIGFILMFILTRNDTIPSHLFLDLCFSSFIGTITWLIYFSICDEVDRFITWIKSNWKEAGKLARKDK